MAKGARHEIVNKSNMTGQERATTERREFLIFWQKVLKVMEQFKIFLLILKIGFYVYRLYNGF